MLPCLSHLHSHSVTKKKDSNHIDCCQDCLGQNNFINNINMHKLTAQHSLLATSILCMVKIKAIKVTMSHSKYGCIEVKSSLSSPGIVGNP